MLKQLWLVLTNQRMAPQTKAYPVKITIKNKQCWTNIWATDVPQTSAEAKSLILSFNPIENSKRVTLKSAIVCRPSGISNPAKLYANPAVRNPTIGGRPTRLINNPKKAKVTSVMIMLCLIVDYCEQSRC